MDTRVLIVDGYSAGRLSSAPEATHVFIPVATRTATAAVALKTKRF